MYPIEKVIAYQKKIASNNYIIVVLSLIIYVFNVALNGIDLSYKSYIFVALIMLLIIEYLLSLFDFFKSVSLIHTIKVIILLLISFMILATHDDFYISSILLLFYIYVSFSIILMINITQSFYRITAILECFMPLMIIVSVRYLLIDESTYYIFIMAAFVITAFSMLYLLLYYSSDMLTSLEEKFNDQERLFFNTQEDYKNLKAVQERLVRANNTLTIQKIQLEAANTKNIRNTSEMSIQFMVLKKISESLEITKLMEYITTSITQYLKIDICGVIIKESMFDSDKQYDFKVSKANDFLEKNIDTYINKGYFDDYFKKQFPQIINNNMSDINVFPFLKHTNINSLLIQQILIEDKISGILIVGKDSINYFQDNISFYNTIVEQCAIALTNAKNYKKMQIMAVKDALTGLYNRRHLNKEFIGIAKNSLENNIPCSVALYDIDRFKNINDTYGHIFGDVVIKYCGEISHYIASKHGGFAARYGGEEFVIVFPGKTLIETNEIIEKLHETIKAKEFNIGIKKVKINISIGLTAFPETCEHPSELLNRADWAMYSSKMNGRGCITIDSKEIIKWKEESIIV